jgi:hypothetical protein
MSFFINFDMEENILDVKLRKICAREAKTWKFMREKIEGSK